MTKPSQGDTVDGLSTSTEISRRTSLYAAMAIVILALVLRGMWGMVVPVVPVSDSVAYDTFATHLAAGGVYGWDGRTPSAYWPVGPAFIYSLVYRVWNPQAWGYGGVVAINLLAGLAVVVLGMMLASRWFGRTYGLIAGVLLAIWPMHIQFTTVIASELFFTAFCLAGILVWPRVGTASNRQLVGQIVAAGVLFAAAAYLRPTALLIPAVLAGSSVLRTWNIWGNGIRWAGVTAVMIALILPWSMRNTSVFDQFVLISTNGGANLWMGNAPGSDGGYQPIPERPPGMNEAQFESQLSREAMANIRSAPLAFVQRSLIKAVRMHERETIGIAWNIEGLRRVAPEMAINLIKAVSQAFWMVVLGLSLAGLALLGVRQGVWWLITHPGVLLWAYFTGVHAVIVYQDRYHFPVTPIIAGLAGVTIMALWQWRMESRPLFQRVPA